MNCHIHTHTHIFYIYIYIHTHTRDEQGCLIYDLLLLAFLGMSVLNAIISLDMNWNLGSTLLLNADFQSDGASDRVVKLSSWVTGFVVG